MGINRMKAFAMGVAAFLAAGGCARAPERAASAALDELMPVPVKVEAREGCADAAAIGRVKVVQAAVPGARAETADEAYVLEVAP